MTSDRIHELEAEVAQLQRHNRLLTESIKQSRRLRQLWQKSAEELKHAKEALKASEERLDLALKGANDGLWDWDLHSNHIYFSPRAVEMLGLPERVQDHTLDAWRTHVHPEDIETFDQNLSDCLGGKCSQFEVTVRFLFGEKCCLWILCRGMPIRNPQDVIIRLVGTTADITERMKVEQQLKLGAEVIQATSEGVVVTDRDNRIEAVNPAFTVLTGYTAEEATGKNPGLLQSGRHDESFYRAMWVALSKKGHWRGEMWNRHKDGSIFVADVSISAISDPSGRTTHYVNIFSDVTRRKHDEERLRRMAYHDSLTGLPNRDVFEDRLEQALRQARRGKGQLAVFYFDLDGFKQVNDTFGHKVGDLLLQEATRRMLAGVREEDTVARIGGDELCAVLRSIDSADAAARVAARVADALNQPFHLDQHKCKISASIGISLYPRNGKDGETLLKRADEAMYQAKRTGKNRFVFYDTP